MSQRITDNKDFNSFKDQTNIANKSNPLTIGKPIRKGDNAYLKLPTSTGVNVFLEVLGSGENIKLLPAQKKEVTHSNSYTVREKGNARQVVMESKNSTVIVEVSDIEKLMGSNKTAKKFFIYNLIKINEQALLNGKLTQDQVSYTLQELVDIGFYTKTNNARRGFKSGMDTLSSLKIKGTSKGKGNQSIESLSVLFYNAVIRNGECIVSLNSHVNWAFLAQYYTIVPSYFFKLSNKASDLLYYICYLARQNTKQIAEKGYFTISFKSIHHKLQLPNYQENKNPQRDIRDPIEEALEEIEDLHNSTYGDQSLSLLPVYDENANIKDFLEKGYLKVFIKEPFADQFIQVNNTTVKKIAQAKAEKERREANESNKRARKMKVI